MNKTISVHPDLFKISKGGRKSTQKNQDQDKNIKVRSQSQLKEKTKTFRKNHVLKFIRDQQHKNIQRMLNPDPGSVTTDEKKQQQDSTAFSSDFEESLKFMNDLSNQPKHNQTLRSNAVAPVAESLLFHSSVPISEYENVCLEMPVEFVKPLKPAHHAYPNWGCLKNGTLPTYRNWRNTTQKNTSFVQNLVHLSPNNNNNNNINNNSICNPVTTLNNMNTNTNNNSVSNPVTTFNNMNTNTNTNNNSISNPFTTLNNMNTNNMRVSTNTMNDINPNIPVWSDQSNQSQNMQKTSKMYYPKQQRIVRRTYKVGKSKTKPTVTVLVSNRTIRNNTTTKSQLLKQVPIEEVRRNLIKKGFIKVGTTAPNDVLRKMYETTTLICGEIQNHNPDNLMYNFFNDTKGTI